MLANLAIEKKSTGFKAKMEKQRPIRDQFPNQHCILIVKNHRFFLVVWPHNGPGEPQKCWGPQNRLQNNFK